MEVVRKCTEKRKLIVYEAWHLWWWLQAHNLQWAVWWLFGWPGVEWTRTWKGDGRQWKPISSEPQICLDSALLNSLKLKRYFSVGVFWLPQLTILGGYRGRHLYSLSLPPQLSSIPWDQGTWQAPLIMSHDITDAPSEPFLRYSFSLLRFPKVLR